MSGNSYQRLKPIGLKVSEEAFDRLRSMATQHGKPLAEWCRDKILEAVGPQNPSPSEYALMAEISAMQAILIDLLCALGRDGKISQQKAQAVVDAAHNAKYKEAAELLKHAYTQSQSGRFDATSGNHTVSKR